MRKEKGDRRQKSFSFFLRFTERKQRWCDEGVTMVCSAEVNSDATMGDFIAITSNSLSAVGK